MYSRRLDNFLLTACQTVLPSQLTGIEFNAFTTLRSRDTSYMLSISELVVGTVVPQQALANLVLLRHRGLTRA